jgi:hypothetical protein
MKVVKFIKITNELLEKETIQIRILCNIYIYIYIYIIFPNYQCVNI